MNNDGGPAFPVKGGMMFYVPEQHSAEIKEALDERVTRQYEGMTLRDWFAGMALAGMCQSAGFQGGPWVNLARNSYAAADAMLAAREAEQSDG